MKNSQIKVLGLVGSPRSQGNTHQLVEYALHRIKAVGFTTELVELSGRNIQACRGCDSCRENKACVIDDDLMPVFEKMLNANGILIGSPVYTCTAPGLLKSLLERTSYLCYTTGRTFERKVGAPIVVSARSGQNFTHAELLMWFHARGFYMVGSDYWNMAIGLKKGDVTKDKMAFQTIDKLIENFVNLLDLQRMGS